MDLFGRRYDNGQPVCLTIVCGRISRIAPCQTGTDRAEQWPWIAPGLFDLQVNGYGGQEFSSPALTPEKVIAIVRGYDAFGLTRCCPTLFTQSFEVLRHSLRAIAAACETSPDAARRIAGIHLEGPYLSKADGPRGAHPLEHCRTPDWDEFQRLQEAAGGRIRLLTLAPELDGAPALVERVASSGVTVAVGHTSASASQIRTAVRAGARLSTHLGNGCHLVLPVLENYLWAQLAEDRLAASFIADGDHLPPDMIKTLVRVKTPGRCILTSDLSGWAGCPPGRYSAGHGQIEILPEGRLVVAGQRRMLAGASRPIGAGVAQVMHVAGLGLEEAIHMATTQPARLLHLPAPGLQIDAPADLVLFDLVPRPAFEGPPCFGVRCTIGCGEVVWGVPWLP